MPRHVDRRSFLKTTAAGAATLAAGPARAAEGGRQTMAPAKTHHELARDVPFAGRSDVLIAGGGPAGVTAAVAAARAGAKTQLLEANGCLGGTWTAGLLGWILDSANKVGLVQEVIARLNSRGAIAKYGGSIGYDVEAMKLVLEELCLTAGVRIRLHTRIVSAARGAGGRLTAAVTESKSGREAWAADAFVDATGDGDLAALAGCRFDYGQPRTGRAQPMSMIVLAVGLDPRGVAEYVRGLAEPRGEKNPKGRLLAEMTGAGTPPSYTSPTLFYLRDGLFCLMANHQYGVAGTSADDLTAATLAGRAEVHRLVDGLRSLGGVWKDMRIVATAEHIGVREGRRVRGLYQVTADDLARGARFPDAVCRCRFPVDVHSTDPAKHKGIPAQRVRAKPYDIPYRSLVAKDAAGLLLAGRCISGDFIAHSSYRVTGDAAAMGEAAGTAAALAARSGRLPHELPWKQIRAALDAARAAASRDGKGAK
jgi:hypothetical protein